MYDGSTTMFNMKLDVEVFELFIIKLSVIIKDDDSREVESTDDGFSNKLFSLGLGDLGLRLSFYLFDEVVDGYKQELPLC